MGPDRPVPSRLEQEGPDDVDVRAGDRVVDQRISSTTIRERVRFWRGPKGLFRGILAATMADTARVRRTGRKCRPPRVGPVELDPFPPSTRCFASRGASAERGPPPVRPSATRGWLDRPRPSGPATIRWAPWGSNAIEVAGLARRRPEKPGTTRCFGDRGPPRETSSCLKCGQIVAGPEQEWPHGPVMFQDIGDSSASEHR